MPITLPIGAFNGSSIVDPQLQPIEQHLIAARVARRSIDLLREFGVDIWLFTNDRWLTRNPDGEYVGHEIARDQARSDHRRGFHALSDRRLQDRRRHLGCAAAATLRGRHARGCRDEATAVRSQTYYLDITPPGHDKGTFVERSPSGSGISTDAVATIGDMHNDLAMFARSGISIAMGNATDDVKSRATHVTDTNERDGFARAIEMVLKINGAS